MRARNLLLIGALFACGGGGGGGGYQAGPTAPPGTTDPPAPSASASVQMQSSSDGYGYESHEFSPAGVSVARGGMVTWTNSSGVAHNVTFSGAGAPPSISSFSSGSQSRTFANAGTFAYSCTNHSGMSGQVVVP